MTNSSTNESEIEKNFKHNFTVNILDGVFFGLGDSFVSARTILPVFLANLTNSSLIIGILSTIVSTGWLLPQLFAANWTQRLPVKKRAPVRWGFFTERLPIFLLVISGWLATFNAKLAIVTFLILIAWNRVGGGVVAVAWQDMLAKIFPTERRGRFFGLANFGGKATGILGASAAAWLLVRYGFPWGYMLCFVAASLSNLISWSSLAMTREPAVEPKEAPISEADYWKRLPKIVRDDGNFRRFLISQAVIAGSGIAWGFIAVYAVQRWALPDSHAGLFTTSLLIGQALGNLFFGWLSDRNGYKLVLELGVLANVLSAGLALFAPNPDWFYAVFALTGISYASLFMSGMMIVFEFCSVDLRPTYIGLSNTVNGVFSAIMPLLGGWLIEVFNYQVVFCIALSSGIVGIFMLRWWVQEPRKVGNHTTGPG
ncbi:MAG: MFS transporter [Anaerolineales bacterium]|nr:MFS transporter [Anaerolineales bacterium]